MNIVDERTEAKKERVPVVPGGVYVQGESAMLLVRGSFSIYHFVSLRNGEYLTTGLNTTDVDATLNRPDSNITYIPDAALILKGAK
jgi:hypothetical protein